jgi:hypothetical protein
MNQHQVRKLIKIVSKMGQKMAIKLFVYTLSKTTANCRMVSKNSAAFFLLPIRSCVRWQCLNLFPLQWFPKQFTQDYLLNYMIGGHAKVKVFLPEHDDYLDVFIKTVKDGRSAITRGWTRVVHAFLHGGHNMGILLHLVQQPECISPLSLPSLIVQVYNYGSSFFVWCLCNSWTYVPMNRIMHWLFEPDGYE